MDIFFEYLGTTYRVPFDAYNESCIVLPDKTVLINIEWSEEFPPTPIAYEAVKYSDEMTVEELASSRNGVVAVQM